MGLPENVIPEDKLPQCWSDDIRMNALFAPFRIKTSNPESWDMKMKFWSDMLRLWCRCRNDPIVSAGDAKFAFQRKGRTPACIEIVIEELFRNGDLSPVSKYQQILHNGPEGWVRWGARLAFRPAAFALTAVSSLLPGRQAIDNDGLPKASIDSTQRFVVESVVKDQATALLESYPADAERVGTVDDLLRSSGFAGTRETFEVLLGYLVSQGAAVKKDDVVKLAEPHSRAAPISESDSASVRLAAAHRRLEGDLSRLARDVATADADARAALKMGDRLAAKNHLRRKQKAKQRADRCEAALDNVRQLASQARDADVNATIVDTYRTSAEAMKRNMRENNLTEDSVHDTMDDLKEVMDSYNEIEKAIAGPTDDSDMAELEAELKELLSPGGGGTPQKVEPRREKVREERKEAPQLPTPPRERPSRRESEREREFVFDCEERVLAELNELSDDDGRMAGENDSPPPKPKPKSTPKTAEALSAEPKAKAPSKPWYPPESAWNNNEYAELRQDERLHPGQEVSVDFSSPPRLYARDFAVRDHKLAGGVWMYRDTNDNVDTGLAASTEYFSSESPEKPGSSFQMAPGGERKRSTAWRPSDETSDTDPETEELERRLRNLRSFNL